MAHDEYAALMGRVKSGDPKAADELINKYGGALRGMVRHVMPRALRQRFDSQDFTQAIWKSLIVKKFAPLHDLQNSTHVRGFLRGVTRNKVNNAHRRNRLKSTGDSGSMQIREAVELVGDVPAEDPTPSMVQHYKEVQQKLFADCTPLQLEMIRLRREGLTYVEIGEQLGCSESKVRRFLNKIEESV